VDVLIAGAGPVGLAVAHGLARDGVDCRLVDQRPAGAAGSRCPVLWPATLHALTMLGLPVAELAGASVPVARKVFHLAGDSFGHGLDDPAGPWPLPLSAGQEALERLLRDALNQFGVTVEYGVRVVTAAEVDDGVLVDVVGASGRDRLCARYLVLALGDSRDAYALAGVGGVARGFSPARALAADGVLTGAGLPDDEEHIFLTDAGHVGFLPLPGGRHRVSLTLPRDDGRSATAALDHVRRHSGVSVRWAESPWHREPRSSLATAFHNGRRFLVGESAKTAPQWAHGLNGGIQDAANLAWKLAAAARGDAGHGLLDSYTVERHAVARTLLAGTERVLRFAGSPRTLRTRFRERRYDLKGQPEVIYAGGPLTAGADDHPVVPAGARLPQAPVVCDGAATTLYDVLAPGRWTALVRPPALAASGRPRPHPVGRDRPCLAVRQVSPLRSGSGLPPLCLVRPDGYVALVASAADGAAPDGSGADGSMVDEFLTAAGYGS
jgi:2-polyprenyl-6-methoxyphenol hydroxylase-like FAD-dependent oxidoreductase